MNTGVRTNLQSMKAASNNDKVSFFLFLFSFMVLVFFFLLKLMTGPTHVTNFEMSLLKLSESEMGFCSLDEKGKV